MEKDFAGRTEINCTPALLNQVVMNILGNAADAMPAGGVIRVVTQSTPDTDLIRISDTGPGIPEALREKIFEPFFTTKPVGAGTGPGPRDCLQRRAGAYAARSPWRRRREEAPAS